ncbi:inactive receptor-like serine/threonine-protein kinase [Senna tora]|uniref:Inactive receptor-like serine/threonine-protein kinase n=1 Tax=Senna tora TaxID=362788 RepID=A0A834T643_9FABA|nr:inactive receptor-like serine/threonine-protein kinase [Senna tora]
MRHNVAAIIAHQAKFNSGNKGKGVTNPVFNNAGGPPQPSTPSCRKASIFHRVRAANSLLRTWSTQQPHHPKLPRSLSHPLPPKSDAAISDPPTRNLIAIPEPPPPQRPTITIPGAEQRVVVYFTSLRVVRSTFEDCKSVRSILQALRVTVDERDLSMDVGFMKELREILGDRKLTLPRVFIDGRYIGGAEEVRQLNETGELRKIVQGLPAADLGVCDVCGGYRFILCEECNGSRKMYSEKAGFNTCTVCNENGLISLSSNSSLNAQGLALLKLKDRVMRDPFGALSNWNAQHTYYYSTPCSCILRNNSFSGEIPKEISQLEDLQVLDLGYNNFSGQFPSHIASIPSLTTLLLNNNDYLTNPAPQAYGKRISEFYGNKDQSSGISLPSNPPQSSWISGPSPASIWNQEYTNSSKAQKFVIIWSTAGGVSLLVFVSAIAFACFRNSKVVTVKPWVTGLSGQLQKAFVTGVPNLRRVEIEAACEDFSNVIGSIPEGTVYKGTLSSGIEIAVASSAITSSRNWSKTMEAQFREKIETLSRVNHKNFVNLIGYCEEKKPFTRMMVFEYAPNGTLFREAERLDWRMRVRITMGIAYCLEHMHQLEPPIAHRNLQSSSIYLTEDYAAQISDLSFWNDMTTIKKFSAKGNVYSFGVILFELITGRIPYDVENGFLAEYVRRGQSLRDMVDPTLNSMKEEEAEKWCEVMRKCLHADPDRRPAMREVVNMLKEITGMGPDEATPKLSPLWWAELEIMSTDST